METNQLRNDNIIAHSAMILALSGIAMLFSASTSAQETTTTTSTTTTDNDGGSGGMGSAFGVKGGANWSTLYVDEAKDVNTRMGFHFGLFGRVAPSGGLGIQAELLYDQKGATFTTTYDAIDQETTYKFDYLSLPLLVVIPLGEVFELHAGGYGAVLLLSEQRFEGDLANSTNDIDDSRFHSFDYGLCGGAGINFDRVQIGARYNHGLDPLAGNDDARFFLGDSKNASLQVYGALALGKA